MLTENVRELMGALVRLSAFASFHKRSLTIDLAKEALEKFIVRKDRVITSDEIVNSVCKYFNVKLADLRSKKAYKEHIFPKTDSYVYAEREAEYVIAGGRFSIRRT